MCQTFISCFSKGNALSLTCTYHDCRKNRSKMLLKPILMGSACHRHSPKSVWCCAPLPYKIYFILNPEQCECVHYRFFRRRFLEECGYPIAFLTSSSAACSSGRVSPLAVALCRREAGGAREQRRGPARRRRARQQAGSVPARPRWRQETFGAAVAGAGSGSGAERRRDGLGWAAPSPQVRGCTAGLRAGAAPALRGERREARGSERLLIPAAALPRALPSARNSAGWRSGAGRGSSSPPRVPPHLRGRAAPAAPQRLLPARHPHGPAAPGHPRAAWGISSSCESWDAFHSGLGFLPVVSTVKPLSETGFCFPREAPPWQPGGAGRQPSAQLYKGGSSARNQTQTTKLILTPRVSGGWSAGGVGWIIVRIERNLSKDCSSALESEREIQGEILSLRGSESCMTFRGTCTSMLLI